MILKHLEHLEHLMHEQKRARNICDNAMSIFYRPVGHKEERRGAFLATTILAKRNLNQ